MCTWMQEIRVEAHWSGGSMLVACAEGFMTVRSRAAHYMLLRQSHKTGGHAWHLFVAESWGGRGDSSIGWMPLK